MKKVMWILLSIIAMVIVAFVMIDGSFLPKRYNKIGNEKYIRSLDGDIYKIISYAIGAPSGHNMQPWLVKILDENTIELYADMDKQLPVIDNENSQLLMGQGSFVEKFKQGAKAYGYNTVVEYAESNLDSKLPIIAHISIEKVNDVTIDTISSSTVAFSSDAEKVNINDSLDIVINNYEGFNYEYIDEGENFDKLQDMMLEATIVESMDAKAAQELIDVFRFTEWQKNEYRFGLSLNNIPQIAKPFIQPIVKLSAKNVEAFGQSGITMFEDRLKTEMGYILIKKENPTELDYIYAGEMYQALINETIGYSLRPAVQLLEKFDAMTDLNKNFQKQYGDDGEVVLIIGVQIQSDTIQSSNPRHLVEDIILD